MAELQVVLVTSPNEKCGIREYGRMLKAAVEAADDRIQVLELPNPDPHRVFDLCCQAEKRPRIVHVNHHAALHAAWSPEHILKLRQLGVKVVVTQHDTFEKFSIMQERGFLDARGADLLLVHEEVEGLDWRPWPQHGGTLAHGVSFMVQPVPEAPEEVRNGEVYARAKQYRRRLLLGTAGFNFPWKNQEGVVNAARQAGWGVRVIAPDITIEAAQALQALGPEDDTEIIPLWLRRERVIELLAECDVVAFPYVTGGSGTSGAIRLGFAAGRPVITTPSVVNRQVRDLDDKLWAMKAAGAAGIGTLLLRVANGTESLDFWEQRARGFSRDYGWRVQGKRLAEAYWRLS